MLYLKYSPKKRFTHKDNFVSKYVCFEKLERDEDFTETMGRVS